MPPVPTSSRTTSDAVPDSDSRLTTSTPSPSSPRRTLPNPATSVRGIVFPLVCGSGFDADGDAHDAVAHRHGQHHQAFVRAHVAVEPVPGAKIVPTTVPAAREL